MPDKHLDLKKELCPKPLILTMSAIKTLEKGDTLSVETTDIIAKTAIPKLCERAGFTLLELTEQDGVICFSIRK